MTTIPDEAIEAAGERLETLYPETAPLAYTKKPISIHAVQWDGTKAQAQRIIDWVHSNGAEATYWGLGEWDADAPDAHYIVIETLEGDMLASPGDWIIQGIRGEFYPCKPDIFADTYVPAEGTITTALKGTQK